MKQIRFYDLPWMDVVARRWRAAVRDDSKFIKTGEKRRIYHWFILSRLVRYFARAFPINSLNVPVFSLFIIKIIK